MFGDVYAVSGPEEKFVARHDEDLDTTTHDSSPSGYGSRMEAPELVRHLSPDERRHLENKLRAKIDLRLMPMIILMYLMNYLDRNNIATARLAGLQKDLKLTQTQYQTCLSILFVGYILMQVPSNLVLNKIGRPAIYLPTCMIVWGIISAATAAVNSYGALVGVRFLLGFVEAAYFPGCLFFLSSWYTRKELALRTAILYAGSLISGAFAGLIAAGIVKGLSGARGLAAWRWLFIIEGAITVAVAIISYFILPNFPRTTTWLSEQERQLAIWRLQEDIGEDDWVSASEQTFWHGFALALRDIKTWILMLMLFCIVGAGAVTLLFPTIVGTLKFNNIDTLLLTAPPYVLAVITTFLNAWHADRTGERFWHVVIPLFVGLCAFILTGASIALNAPLAAKYLGMILIIPGTYTGYVVILAWISNTIPRPPAKRAAALAAINAVSNAAQIYAPYMYQAPSYTIATVINCVNIIIAMACALVLRMMLAKLNKKLDRGEHVEGAVMGVPGEAARKGFRFLL